MGGQNDGGEGDAPPTRKMRSLASMLMGQEARTRARDAVDLRNQMTIRSLLTDISARDKADFVQRLGCPVLLDMAASDALFEGGFHTAIGTARKGSHGGKNPGQVVVMPVRKSGNSPYEERISVGRTRRNDVVLLHQSVSKFHAYFSKEESVWALTDAGSRNGTLVESVRIRSHCPQELSDDCSITFGMHALRFVSAEFLYNLLRTLPK